MPHFGEEGQQKLSRGSVLIFGDGGLGSPATLYLEAAGVGRIGLVDFDDVDSTNPRPYMLLMSTNAWMMQSGTVAYRVHSWIFLRPVSPSFCSFSKDGSTVVRS